MKFSHRFGRNIRNHEQLQITLSQRTLFDMFLPDQITNLVVKNFKFLELIFVIYRLSERYAKIMIVDLSSRFGYKSVI